MKWRALLLSLLLALPFAGRAEEVEQHDVVIIGGGPGALTAGLYLSRLDIQPIIVEGSSPGGLIAQSHLVQNWPGEMAISGADLIDKLRNQAKENGAILLSEELVAADFSKRPYSLTLRDVIHPEKIRKIKATSCIIAMGTTPNRLGIEGESSYWGKGVSNCAVCDGPLYKGKTVAIIGGGDAAILEADYLSQIARKVHIFVRSDAFHTVEEKRKKELLSRPNVEVHFQTTAQKIDGDSERVTQIQVNEKGKRKPIDVQGVFLAIGSKPNTQLFKDALELDNKGYIVLKKGQQTSLPGVYAIGDIVDPIYKQAVSAASDGARAAIDAHKELLNLDESVVARGSSKKTNTAPVVQGPIIKEIATAEEFEQALKENKLPVVIDFYATWCAPCKKISALLEEKALALSGQYLFYKVNIDTLASHAERYDIRSMPTVLLFESGKETGRKVGTYEISKFFQDLKKKKNVVTNE